MEAKDHNNKRGIEANDNEREMEMREKEIKRECEVGDMIRKHTLKSI
jgi:hypothetical protein